MSYTYAVEKGKLFTEDGQVMFLKIRDNANRLLSEAGAFTSGHAWKNVTGDTWQMMACLDRLVEIGELKEIAPNTTRGQDRIFVKPFRS